MRWPFRHFLLKRPWNIFRTFDSRPEVTAVRRQYGKWKADAMPCSLVGQMAGKAGRGLPARSRCLCRLYHLGHSVGNVERHVFETPEQNDLRTVASMTQTVLICARDQDSIRSIGEVAVAERHHQFQHRSAADNSSIAVKSVESAACNPG